MTEQRNAVAAIPENGLEISRLLTECSLLREKVKEDRARIAELEAAAQCVHDTFKSDLDQGYKTKDKVFAVEVLGKALAGKGK